MLHRVLKTMKVEAYVSKKGTKKKKKRIIRSATFILHLQREFRSVI